ncbi:MAG: biotin/lipoyl-binding protein [Pedosphaera sp.]|nr:biotin/lipoyl-binding protein [Pedosphaera sp.]
MDVRLPKIGDNTDSGTVVSILVKPGDAVTAGQIILELENEKAIAPIPSPAAGKVSSVAVTEGQKISAGTVILTLEGAAAASPGAVKSLPKAAKRPTARTVDVDEDEEDDLPAAVTADDGPIPAASPYVRKVARDLGIRLSQVRGSESAGRVVLADLARYISRLERRVARAGRHADEPRGLVFQPVNQDFSLYGPVTSEPLTAVRKFISARMVENSISLPHVTQFDDADMTVIEELRARYKAGYEKAGGKLTPTPFLIHALAQVLQKHPRLNASVNEVTETLVLKQYCHIGIAVDTDAGLLVPVLRNAHKKTLLEIALDLAAIADRARARKVGLDEMKGGSFTLSNQGAIGSGYFTPIINKPEVAILGVGKTALKPVVTAEGTIAARPMMPLTLSYDHRVVDGGGAARFMVDLVTAINSFPEALVKL